MENRKLINTAHLFEALVAIARLHSEEQQIEPTSWQPSPPPKHNVDKQEAALKHLKKLRAQYNDKIVFPASSFTYEPIHHPANITSAIKRLATKQLQLTKAALVFLDKQVKSSISHSIKQHHNFLTGYVILDADFSSASPGYKEVWGDDPNHSFTAFGKRIKISWDIRDIKPKELEPVIILNWEVVDDPFYQESEDEEFD